jgi:hypothetical protein
VTPAEAAKMREELVENKHKLKQAKAVCVALVHPQLPRSQLMCRIAVCVRNCRVHAFAAAA